MNENRKDIIKSEKHIQDMIRLMIISILCMIIIYAMNNGAYAEDAWYWPFPTSRTVNSGFRTSDRPNHDGVDIGAEIGDPICAVNDGTIYKLYTGCNRYGGYDNPCCNAGVCSPNHGYCNAPGKHVNGFCNEGYGNGVCLLTDDGYYVQFAHMESVSTDLYEGKRVTKGTVLGKVGGSGHATGKHCHYAVATYGEFSGFINPMNISYVYTLGKKLSVSSENGIINGASNVSYISAGTSLNLTAVPVENYKFSKWIVSGVPGLSEPTSNPLSFTMPDNEVTVKGVFVRDITKTITQWKSTSITSTTKTSASLSAQYYYAASSVQIIAFPHLYLLWGTDRSAVVSATPDNQGNTYLISFGQPEGTSPALLEYYYNVSATIGPLGSLGISLLSPSQTFYYKWVAVQRGQNIESAVGSGTTKGQSATWSNLRTNDPSYGLFTAQVNWSRSVSMSEVGCFVSTSQSSVSNATKSNYSGCAMRNDVGGINTMSSLSTDDTYGTIAFYKGPSFGSISSFNSGTIYYYKFYSITSDGEEVHSAIGVYTPGGGGSQGLTQVNMVPNYDLNLVEGTSYTFQYSADQASIFYFHIYDSSTEIDTPYKLSGTVTQGTYTYTFNKPGYYHVYFGAEHPLGNMSCNGIHVTVRQRDTSVPVITTARVDNITSDGYDVIVNATDDTAVSKIRIGTWHSGITTSSAQWKEATGGSATFHINTSDFSNAKNVVYYTDAYAYDAAGNVSAAVRCGNVNIETQPPVIENVRIEQVSSEGYDVVYEVRDNWAVRSVTIEVSNDKGTSYSTIVYYGDSSGSDSYIYVSGPCHIDANNSYLNGMVDTVYHTTVYAQDLCGNVSEVYNADDVFVGTLDLYANRNESMTMYLPESLSRIESQAFLNVNARYFVLPYGVSSIGSQAFPVGSTVYLYASQNAQVELDAIEGGGTFVELSNLYNGSFAQKMKDSSSDYVLRNGTKPTKWSDWSDWSDTAVIADGSTDVQTKTVFRYRDTTYTTEYGEWGSWSYYDTVRNTITDPNTMQEDSARVYIWYWYTCSSCGWPSPRYGNSVCGNCGGNVGSGYNVAWLDVEKYGSNTFNFTHLGSTKRAYNGPGIPVGQVYYNDEDNNAATYTGYRYRTRTSRQVPSVGEWSVYQDDMPDTNSNREIESKTMYRYRTKEY